MISVNCDQCGTPSRLADEICKSCGAELHGRVGSFNPETSAYPIQQPTFESADTRGEEFKTTPVIRPFDSIGAVINPAIDIFKNNVWLIAKIILVVFAPFEFFKALGLNAHNGAGWEFVMGTYFLALVCKALVAPSLIFAILTVMRTGVAPSVNESYRWGSSRLGKLVVCALMAWVLQMLGFICLIIPGVILGLAFELIYPMAVLEKGTPFEILKRSYRLTKGYRGRIFGAVFVISLLCAAATIPAGLVSGILIGLGINVWPVEVALSLFIDIVNESTTILSLVIYLSILTNITADPMSSSGQAVHS